MPSDPILVLNGPNLNLLGTREPHIYGRETLADLEAYCRKVGNTLGAEILFEQSNAEAFLIDWIQRASTDARGLVLNAAAYSYSSYAILDALRACQRPKIEVHLTNIHAREEDWRSNSLISPAVTGIISGLGFEGYGAAIRAIARLTAHE